MIQGEALVCRRHQASFLGGQDDRSNLRELQQNTTKVSFTEVRAVLVRMSKSNWLCKSVLHAS